MKINFSISLKTLRYVLFQFTSVKSAIVLSVSLAIVSTAYFFLHNNLIAYGDAESHLNIAKRVSGSLTPGFAQLGGIWLPIPHILLIPFVAIDPLWRSGLAGAII